MVARKLKTNRSLVGRFVCQHFLRLQELDARTASWVGQWPENTRKPWDGNHGNHRCVGIYREIISFQGMEIIGLLAFAGNHSTPLGF